MRWLVRKGTAQGAVIISAFRKFSRAALPLAVGVGMMGAVLLIPVEEAGAQALAVSVPAAVQMAPNSEASFPIEVGPSSAVPRRAMILIRGLPTTIALSEGRLFESGVWGVPTDTLNRLKISTASSAVGRVDLIVSLVALDGTLLAESRSSLIVSPGAVPATANADMGGNTVFTAAPSYTLEKPREAAPVAKRLSAEQADQLLALVKRGDDQMRVGNVSAARLLYQHAAEGGLAAGAMALAATFDDAELKKLRVVGGVQADPKQAQRWYERAWELGSPEARDRLQRLGAR